MTVSPARRAMRKWNPLGHDPRGFFALCRCSKDYRNSFVNARSASRQSRKKPATRSQSLSRGSTPSSGSRTPTMSLVTPPAQATRRMPSLGSAARTARREAAAPALSITSHRCYRWRHRRDNWLGDSRQKSSGGGGEALHRDSVERMAKGLRQRVELGNSPLRCPDMRLQGFDLTIDVLDQGTGGIKPNLR
jgi:hypothetical protein